MRKGEQTMFKKSLALVLSICLILSFSACGKTNAPTDEQVISILQKGETVYQMGNTELLQITQYEEMINGAYYDKIEGYTQVVSELFTEQGIAQLEKTHCLGVKLILIQPDGSVYRASSMTESATTLFYGNVTEVKLLSQKDNLFTYQISHISSPINDDGEQMSSQIILKQQDDKLLIESFGYPLSDKVTQ